MGAEVTFAIVDPEQGREAYQWHRGFAATDEHIFPRPWELYQRLAYDGCVMCARDAQSDYLGLAYFSREEGSPATWEIGGLMVSIKTRGSGIGTVLGFLTLAHVLFEEDPLSRGESVIAHVHAENDKPRKLLSDRMRFAFSRRLKIPGAALPGLKPNAEGFVEGDELKLTRPDALLALAEWCESWTSTLLEGRRAEIGLREGTSLTMWAQAFRQMAGLAP